MIGYKNYYISHIGCNQYSLYIVIQFIIFSLISVKTIENFVIVTATYCSSIFITFVMADKTQKKWAYHKSLHVCRCCGVDTNVFNRKQVFVLPVLDFARAPRR